MKNKTIKITIFAFFAFFFLCFCMCLFAFFNYLKDDKDSCLDVGICKEGIIVNVENKKIKINNKTCVENSGIWNKDKNACYFKTKQSFDLYK